MPASALARKVVPRKRARRRADRIVVESEIDRDALVRSLSEAGYLRVPVVEDPGASRSAARSSTCGRPRATSPVRVELYGDLVLSMKPFDPVEQKTRKDAPELKTLWLPPAREAILDPRDGRARARSASTQLAEAIDWPTTKTRALVDDVTTGARFFGAEGFLPAYYEELDPLLAYVPRDAVVCPRRSAGLTRAVRDELERAARDAASRRAGPASCPVAFYATRTRSRDLGGAPGGRAPPHGHRGRGRRGA